MSAFKTYCILYLFCVKYIFSGFIYFWLYFVFYEFEPQFQWIMSD